METKKINIYEKAFNVVNWSEIEHLFSEEEKENIKMISNNMGLVSVGIYIGTHSVILNIYGKSDPALVLEKFIQFCITNNIFAVDFFK